MRVEVFARGDSVDRYVGTFADEAEAGIYINRSKGETELFIPTEESPARLVNGKTVGKLTELENRDVISSHFVAETNRAGTAVILYADASDGNRRTIMALNEVQLDVFISSLAHAKLRMMTAKFNNVLTTLEELGK